jgi:Fe(3+) dicitrate transport protein
MSARSPLFVALTLAFLAAPAVARDDASVVTATKLDRLSVLGSAEQAAETAGSATFLDQKTLQVFDFTDIHRVLRQVPGVYIVDEDGYGVRPNIGIRGSGTDRNNRITVMEDGLLIAPAPYAAPAAYYFPATARMSAVEIRKGSSAIKAGPRTTGGAVNLVSTPIPRSNLEGLADIGFGKDSTLLGHAWLGGSSDTTGWLLETVQQDTDGFKQLDGGGDTGYQLRDYLFKGRINSGSNADFYQELELKAVKGDNVGDETYLGLTLDDFRDSPYRRYRGSQVDRIDTEHEQLSLRHRIELGHSLDLTTAIYRHEFSRAWYKLQDVTGTSLSNILTNPSANAERLAWLRGADSPVNALRVRNNNRAYYGEGGQSVLGWRTATGSAEHQFEFGLRWHRDEEDRFQQDDRYQMLNGEMVLTSAGLPGSQENRVVRAQALSFFTQDEVRLGQWIITPGVRFESINLKRLDYALNPNGRDNGPTRLIESDVNKLLPGIGVTRLISDDLSAFVSLHKGFNPPAPGALAKAEESINSEAGLRWSPGRFNGELIGFFNDYSNLVGTCTASTGGNCTIGDQFDGGEARVSGFEASASYNFGDSALSIPLQAGYTWTNAEFRSSFVSSFEEWATVTRGDELPYLPEHTLFARIGVETARWSFNVGSNYIDDMRTRAGQSDPAPTERTDSAWVFDLAARYRVNDIVELYTRVENLGDKDYISSWRPAGARPGRERTALAGVRLKF